MSSLGSWNMWRWSQSCFIIMLRSHFLYCVQKQHITTSIECLTCIYPIFGKDTEHRYIVIMIIMHTNNTVIDFMIAAYNLVVVQYYNIIIKYKKLWCMWCVNIYPRASKQSRTQRTCTTIIPAISHYHHHNLLNIHPSSSGRWHFSPLSWHSARPPDSSTEGCSKPCPPSAPGCGSVAGCLTRPRSARSGLLCE